MANILLGVTGSVASIYTPELFADLRAVGHAVKVVATTPALHFFDASRLGVAPDGSRDRAALILDGDEWPTTGYQRGDAVLHIELRRWAELFLVAPLDANTLAKFALGLADNCLTCVYRAWDRTKPIVLCPAMNTLMWEHPVTARHLHQIAEDLIVESSPGLRVVGPIVKKLACDDVGTGAMANRDEILRAVSESLAPHAHRREAMG